MSKQIRLLETQHEFKQRGNLWKLCSRTELFKIKEEIRKLDSRYSTVSEELYKLEQSKHELDKRNEVSYYVS